MCSYLLSGTLYSCLLYTSGTRAMQGCIACGKCAELGHCVFSDAVYTAVREKLAQADGLVAVSYTHLRRTSCFRAAWLTG